MSNCKLNQEISVVQVVQINDENTENEAKTNETENYNQKSVAIGICDIANIKTIRESQLEYKAKDNNDLKTDISKTEALYGYLDSSKEVNLQQYWVQFNFAGGSRIPDSGGSPLYYDPDRNIFVRVVFAILLLMLVLTGGFVAFVYMTDLKNVIIRFGMIILIVGMVGMLGLNYAMMCSACTRTPPCNIICLFLAVIFMSLIAAYITAQFRTQVVLLALLATTVTVIVCLCLACTSFDFTKYLLYVIVLATAFAALALIVTVTMFLTNTRYKPITLAILIIGTMINVIILTIELQMILGGRTVEISEDDYALGAFMLYTSIVDIFLKLVQILGICDSDY